MSAQCRLVNGFAWLTSIGQALKETPINGGLNSEDPKVAEYLGR